jgi:hypothetical protein
MRMRALVAVVGLIVGVPACEAPPAGNDRAPGEVVAGPISERTIIFMYAAPGAIERAREGLDADAIESMGDHLGWYRAMAFEFFEGRGLPVRSVDGRPPLEFVVAGEARRFTFEDEPGLDLVVLYVPGRAPLAIAPIEVGLPAMMTYLGLDP